MPTWFKSKPEKLNMLAELMDGRTLTPTLSGTGSATVKMYANKIIVTVAAGQVDKTITLPTPYGCKVVGIKSIHGDTTAATVTLKNNTTAISDALTHDTTDKQVKVESTIDDAAIVFAKGDNDMVLTIGTGAYTGIVIIDIALT